MADHQTVQNAGICIVSQPDRHSTEHIEKCRALANPDRGYWMQGPY